MAACVTIRLSVPKPASSEAVDDVDKLALILAEPSLDFFGDETTLANAGGQVASWGNRKPGGYSYAQTNVARQPAFTAAGGPIAGVPYALFSATGDTNADRLLTSGAAVAPNGPHTVITVLRLDTNSSAYLDGLSGAGADSIFGDCRFGMVRQAYGDATAGVRIDQGQWAIVTRSWDGAGQIEIHCDGRADMKTATAMPTTPRLLHLGVTSNDNSAATFAGGIAAPMHFSKWIGADRTFFRDVVGAYLMERYQRPINPIARV